MSDSSSNSPATSDGWNGAGTDATDGAASDTVARVGFLLEWWFLVAVAVGVLSGMAAFMFAHSGLLPPGVPSWVPAAVVAFAGGVVPVFVKSLSRSIWSALVGFFVGVMALTLAWIGPWWLLPYTAGSRDLLLYSRLGRVVVHAMSSLLLPYFAGYFTALFAAGYLDP